MINMGNWHSAEIFPGNSRHVLLYCDDGRMGVGFGVGYLEGVKLKWHWQDSSEVAYPVAWQELPKPPNLEHISEETLKILEDMEKVATKRNWTRGACLNSAVSNDAGGLWFLSGYSDEQAKRDANLICEMRNNLPELIAEIRRLRKKLGEG